MERERECGERVEEAIPGSAFFGIFGVQRK